MNAITVDFADVRGPIKPLHGVNNGPLSWGGLTNTSAEYREAGIPIVRLHDPDWPNPYHVDIPKVFPDFSADPDDPSSYRFAQTDDLIAAIYACGAEPLYRLGVSIEHFREKIYAVKPDNFEKWTSVCVHLIRHYNEGWADGFHYGIRFFEIWNEADGGDNMWTNGTPEDYYRLYVMASKAIKAACPQVLVGGYAGCTVNNPSFMKGFFETIRRERAPLDFFSWHKYSTFGNISQFVEDAATARRYLREYGYPDALSILDEWNYMCGQEHWDAMFGRTPNARRRELFELQKTMVGASFCAGVMAALQGSEADMAVYYDGQPHMQFCGLFDMYGVPQKTYCVFQAFNRLYRLGGQAAVFGSLEKVYALAAAGGTRAAVLLANHDGEDVEIDLRLQGLGGRTGLKLSLLDDENDLAPVREERLSGEAASVRVALRRNTVQLLELE